MVPVETTPDLKWIRSLVTPKFLQSVLPKSFDLSSDARINPELIYCGTHSEVYKVTVKSSDRLRESKAFVVKRFLSPDESIPMHPGVPTSAKPLDQWEYINLTRLHEIDPNQPEPFLHNSSDHLVVMEALNGSYNKRFEAQYRAFKRMRSQRKRESLVQEVQHDLETVLDQAHTTLAGISQLARSKPGDVCLRSHDYFDFLNILDENFNAFFRTADHLAFPHEDKKILTQLLTNSLARDNRLTGWRNRYTRERPALADYLGASEGVIHRDFRPDNILYRSRDGSDSPTSFALCDLTDMSWGPIDLDMISLLMDPRFKAMFSLDQRFDIYNKQFDTLVSRHSPELMIHLTREQRFDLGSTAVLFNNIGRVFTYLSGVSNVSKNPPSGISHLPLGTPEHYFVAQYLSLLQVLKNSRQQFPRLYAGALSFIPEQSRPKIINPLSNPLRKDDPSHILLRLYQRGKRLSERLSSGISTS
ncbi:phosphotransferase [Candidatus Woesearchaeota archaeon]|nr:phosphotransferase [Candidatus Woesearchaeota archaeon]